MAAESLTLTVKVVFWVDYCGRTVRHYYYEANQTGVCTRVSRLRLTTYGDDDDDDNSDDHGDDGYHYRQKQGIQNTAAYKIYRAIIIYRISF